MPANQNDINIIKLKSVFNEMDLRMMEAILDDNKIPYGIIKDYGLRGHMRIMAGGSIFGADIMVEELILKKQGVC